MPCRRCEKEEGYHSFEFQGRTTHGDAIFLTRVSNSKEIKLTEESMKDYITHMDEASISSWIWIFDCRGMEKIEVPSLKSLKTFSEIIEERYKFVLKQTVLLHPNWKMNIMLSMLQPFMKDESKKRIIRCESSLQLYEKGVSADLIRKLA